MLFDDLFKTGREFLGCRYPVMCGAMSWVSDHKLVSAVGEAGAFGLLAGGNMPIEMLRDEILETRKRTVKPFGVNLITIAPNYQSQLDMVCEMDCPVVVFAGSFPREKEIIKAKNSGAKVVCFAPTEALAHKLVAWGTDALILEGSEAGGHIGPVALTVLLQQLLFKIEDVPIFVAGGIATGKMMAHLMLMGAVGIQMGTLFVMSEECTAHDKFKETFKKSKARDATATPQFDSRLPVIPVRSLKNSGTERFRKLQLKLLEKLDRGEIDRMGAQHEVERFWMGALRSAVVDGDVEQGSLMAGQSVGLVNEIKPLNTIIKDLVNEAEQTLVSIKDRLCR